METVTRPIRICSVDQCERKHEAKGLCHPHYERARRGVSVASPIGLSVGQAGALNPNWRGDNVGYLGAHHRVYQTRGAASAHSCMHCGGGAVHWAYDHTDPSPSVGADGLYSLDTSRYIPLCVPCHKAFDRSHAEAIR